MSRREALQVNVWLSTKATHSPASDVEREMDLRMGVGRGRERIVESDVREREMEPESEGYEDPFRFVGY